MAVARVADLAGLALGEGHDRGHGARSAARAMVPPTQKTSSSGWANSPSTRNGRSGLRRSPQAARSSGRRGTGSHRPVTLAVDQAVPRPRLVSRNDRHAETRERQIPAAVRCALLASAMATRRALLLIADIGGYTEYMQFHRSILGHAEAATTRMLDKVVDAARGFDLIEIEGDAAFLSRDADGLDGAATLAAITERGRRACTAPSTRERRLRRAQHVPVRRAARRPSDLKLKFVAHVGEVATQTIKRRRKLVGMDVIHVHRLLKNPVQVPEYVLVSEELYRTGGTASSELAMHEIAAGPRGHRARAHLLRRTSRTSPGPLAPLPDPSLAAAHRRDVRHGRPRPAVHARGLAAPRPRRCRR